MKSIVFFKKYIYILFKKPAAFLEF
jgi:hypothetical protein